MSLILALALGQAPAFTGTVPQPNTALDAAHACLRAGLADKLADGAPAPEVDGRWQWALKIAEACEAQINAAADSKEAVDWIDSNVLNGVSKRQLLRSEALYFVDRLIREHYEAKT